MLLLSMAMSVKILFGNEMEVKLMAMKNKIKQSLKIIIGLNWIEESFTALITFN